MLDFFKGTYCIEEIHQHNCFSPQTHKHLMKCVCIFVIDSLAAGRDDQVTEYMFT